MNVAKPIAIKFQAQQHKHVIVHTTALNKERKLIKCCPIILEAESFRIVLLNYQIAPTYAM